MANPEQTDSENLSRPGVDRLSDVQDGADKVYNRPGPRGKNTIMWVSLAVAAVVAVIAGLYLF